jgi:hypothetical protein
LKIKVVLLQLLFPVTDLNFANITNGIKVSGRVENASDKDKIVCVAVVLFDANDKPIVVLYTYADVAARGKMRFETSESYLPDDIMASSKVTYRAYAYPLQFPSVLTR